MDLLLSIENLFHGERETFNSCCVQQPLCFIGRTVKSGGKAASYLGQKSSLIIHPSRAGSCRQPGAGSPCEVCASRERGEYGSSACPFFQRIGYKGGKEISCPPGPHSGCTWGACPGSTCRRRPSRTARTWSSPRRLKGECQRLVTPQKRGWISNLLPFQSWCPTDNWKRPEG